MNIFISESAPFAIVVLAAALGWYISTLQESLGDRLSLLYAFESGKEDTVSLRVDNISRAQSFHGTFSVTCVHADTDRTCLDLNKRSEAQYRVVEPYNLSNEVEPRTSPDGKTVMITAWIPPSASIRVEFISVAPKPAFKFHYLPENIDKSQITPEFHSAGVQSFIIGNFDQVLIWIFILSLVCLGVFVIIQFFALFRPKRNSKDDDLQRFKVTVQHHFSGDRSADDR